METLTKCPVCDGTEFQAFLQTKDFFLTGEQFDICRCVSCGFKFVNPRPTFEDIKKYYQSDDYISHNSSGWGLFNTAYRIARHFSILQKFKLIRGFSNAGTILDIGCGTGELLKFCKRKGMTVQGVEPNEVPRRYAIDTNKIEVSPTLDSLIQEQRAYSCITMWHVLEHIHRLNETFEEIHSLLAQDGHVIIAVPNHLSYDAQKYGEFWAAYDVPRHLYHFTSETFLLLAEKWGFTVQKVLPQKLDAFYVSSLSEKYKKGASNYLSAFQTGCKSNYYAASGKLGYSSLIFVLKRKNSK